MNDSRFQYPRAKSQPAESAAWPAAVFATLGVLFLFEWARLILTY